MMKETQGQELCHEYITGSEPCDAKQCVAQCIWRHTQGKGACLPSSKTCLCSFSCTI